MNYRHVLEQDPELFRAMTDEVERQRHHIELIASENFVTPAAHPKNAYCCFLPDLTGFTH